MKKLISSFLIIFVVGTILTGCGKVALTDVVDSYEFCGVEDDIIYWDVYFNDDYKASNYDYEDFIDVIKECMSRSGQYSFSYAWILAFDSEYTNRFVWNSKEDKYIIVQKDGTLPDLREYEWKLTPDEVNEIWDSIGYKATDNEETSRGEDAKKTDEEIIEVSIESGEVPEDYYWESLYIKPEYDEFKTPASENGLDGTLIQVNGIITDIKNDTDYDFYYLTEGNGNVWVFAMYNNNPVKPDVGDDVTVYGEYRGQAANYDDKPFLIAIRCVSGNDMVKMTAHDEDLTYSGYVYPGFEGYPSEYVTDVEESEDDGFYHYILTLSEWDDLDFDKQCYVARNWVEYCEDLFAISGLSKDDFDINAYDENGNTAFVFSGGDEVRIYIRNT